MNSAATVAGRRADDKGEEAGVSIGEGDKLINVVLLNGERLNVRVQASATGQDLYNIITDHLGLTETTFFGLMIIKDGEHEFLDFNEKLSKLAKFAPHLWKDDVSCNSSLVFTIFFRVKYYVENICLLQQQSTRHLYYLQLRKDVLEGGIYVHEETAMLLASYALQAEVGDYNQTLHGSDYFVPEHYLPQRAIAKLTASSIKKQLPSMHKTHTGLSDAQAEIEYLKEAQKLQEYGIIFNKVSKFKKDKRGGYSLGISVRGLIVYEERGIVKSPTFRHPWQNIKRMAFHRRRFYIEAHGDPETSKLVLYTCSYKKSRYLLKMCTSFYKFQMMMGMRLSNLKEYPKDGVVRMNGTVKTDETDSVAGEITASTAAKPGQDSGVIQPPGIGPAIHLNGSTCTVQEDQPVQVSVHPVQLQKVDGSLGLNIIGGIELGGIYVKTMAPEGPASLSGKINIGDRILEINGQSLEGLSRQEAVNILRTAPYVCTMLIESCVAAPATPNGKPAMPGSQSASAFYQPNRQQQMQPMMQRQPSLESQYSSMYQQFVPSQSHQIEDIASVSTLSIDKAKSEQNRCEATAWGRPLAINPAAVSTQIRQRAMRKKMMINENACHEGKGDHIVGTSTGVGQTSVSEPKYSEKDNNPEDASPQIRQGAKTDTVSRIGITFFGRFQEKRDEHEAIITRDDRASKGDLHFLGSCNLEQEIATRDDSENMKNVSEGICQNEAPPVDEQAKLLGCTDQKGSQSEDSSVAGFFRKIQSFLFSPSPSKLKRNDESESSCCESDFDSEFSEMTSGSFNAGEIEAMREELDSLLLRDSPTPESAGLDDLSFGESPEVSVSRSKLLESEIKEVTCLGNTEKNLDALEGKINLKSDLGGDIDPGKLCKNDKLLELEADEINKVKNIEVGEQQIACEGAKCQLNGEKSEAKSSAMGAAVDVEESKKACDHNESQMYTTVSGLVKVQKETTV